LKSKKDAQKEVEAFKIPHEPEQAMLALFRIDYNAHASDENLTNDAKEALSALRIDSAKHLAEHPPRCPRWNEASAHVNGPAWSALSFWCFYNYQHFDGQQ